MVTVNSTDGSIDKTPYLALQNSRRIAKKLLFGQHLTLDERVGEGFITVGDQLAVRR